MIYSSHTIVWFLILFFMTLMRENKLKSNLTSRHFNDNVNLVLSQGPFLNSQLCIVSLYMYTIYHTSSQRLSFMHTCPWQLFLSMWNANNSNWNPNQLSFKRAINILVKHSIKHSVDIATNYMLPAIKSRISQVLDTMCHVDNQSVKLCFVKFAWHHSILQGKCNRIIS